MKWVVLVRFYGGEGGMQIKLASKVERLYETQRELLMETLNMRCNPFFFYFFRGSSEKNLNPKSGDWVGENNHRTKFHLPLPLPH